MMKLKNISILILFLTVILNTRCQEASKTPEAVKQTFQKMYPGENDPDWHIDANGNFEANFKKKGLKYRADYNPNGTWIETERSIKKKDLPKIVRDKIDSDFDKEELTEIEEVQHATKGIFYDVEFKRKGKNKDVEFKADGTIIN